MITEKTESIVKLGQDLVELKKKRLDRTSANNKTNPLEPIVINDINCIANHEIEQIVSKYDEHGFVIYEINEKVDGDQLVYNIARAINLDDPYVPDHYKNHSTMYKNNKLNVISSGNVNNHKAFRGGNQQDLHSDGTVHEIGFIKTTILFCQSSATKGGESIIFNTIDAFYELLEVDLEAAIAMLHPRSLKRTADIGFIESHIGPAFAIENDEIITRFTLDHTADWTYGFENIPNLKRAYEFLSSRAKEGSKQYMKFQLKDKQGIIMANDKIAHGRTAFIESEGAKRKLLRGLYLKRPQLNKGKKTN
ncbi:TauD/TfdA family dioxygenase [Priestia filamentosa]|uniref:TauD/TfdA family dioxygenase n=1 Tax=Priestia filamentosa TaxID=1402861 RepID=UPI001FB51F48|nr:TauD/TfdA family dioxygenase [Priestia filamentosa]UOE58262.1 TauD/TfdA family dioxygenase [Priestia filamentosa]